MTKNENTNMRNYIIISTLILMTPLINAAEVSQEKIQEYLIVCKVKKRYEHFILNYYEQMNKNYPYLKNVKDEYIALLKEMWPYEKYREIGVENIVKKFTESELDELIKAFKTEVFQKSMDFQQEAGVNWSEYSFKKNVDYGPKMHELFKKAANMAKNPNVENDKKSEKY